MKFTQILLASSIAALSQAAHTMLRLRQDVVEEDTTGDNGADCGDVCRYYKACKKALKDEYSNAIDNALTEILTSGAVTMLDGTAFADNHALHCQLRAEYDHQVANGLYTENLDLTVDDVMDCADFPELTAPVVDTDCETKETQKLEDIGLARGRAVDDLEFALFLAS